MKPNMKWWISLTVVACVMLTAALASAQQAAGLTAVGAPDPANGYPKWYIDRNGVQLAPCLVTPADDPCALAGTFPNPAAPIVFPTNFPDEFFYMRATARIDGIGGVGRADLGYALEGAFGGATGTAADGAGAQIVFARFRLRVTAGLVPGETYTMTAPYGTQSFVAAATGTINFTSDQGCAAAPCNFASLLTNTNVGPFVRWDATGRVHRPARGRPRHHWQPLRQQFLPPDWPQRGRAWRQHGPDQSLLDHGETLRPPGDDHQPHLDAQPLHGWPGGNAQSDGEPRGTGDRRA